MTDAAIELLQRYREREAKGVGGLTPYGMPHRHQETFQQQQLVFIEDATVEQSDEDGVNHHIPAWVTLTALQDSIDGGPTVTHTIIARFNRAPVSLATLFLRGVLASFFVDPSNPDNAPNHQATLTIKAITEPLVGDLAIENITFADIIGLSVEGFADYELSWTGSGSGVVLTNSSIETADGIYLSAGAVLTNGPYFGLLFDVTGSTSFTAPSGRIITTFVLKDSTLDAASLLTRSGAITPQFLGL